MLDTGISFCKSLYYKKIDYRIKPDNDIFDTFSAASISTTATFVNKYSFAPSMISMEKNYDYENQSAELAAIVDSEAPEYYFAMDDIFARPWNYKKRMSRKSKRLIGHPA